MLEAQGLLDPADCSAIAAGLEDLGRAYARGEWQIELADEDVHTALERRLVETIGEPGGRVHLGRSRNDQVLTALRLYMKDAIVELSDLAAGVIAALESLAGQQGEIALPGYTHMQPAMPSTVRLWAEGFAAEIADDREGLLAAVRRADKSPLGSAAGYGTPHLPIDRDATRSALGFAAIHEPVTAVQLSRGKAEASLLFELTLVSADLGRLAADLMLFYMDELGFVKLPPEMTTGSSIMPQKRNPDVFELVRAASATVQSALVEALGITAKLPSGYHRDLQRLKSPLFRGVDLTADCLAIMAYAIRSVEFRPEKISLDPALFAAEKANRLVLDEGIPFRDAYRRVAGSLKHDGDGE
jgi:argininosuccinate lyase